MLELTPAVRAALEWFEATHDMRYDEGIPRWIRIALPRAGGAGEQDAKLMETLDYLLGIEQAILQRRVKVELRARREAGRGKEHRRG